MTDDRDQTPEDELPPMLRRALHDYNAPPPVPREEIWARIEAARRLRVVDGGQAGTPTSSTGRRTMRRLLWPLSAAALVALGIGIGRLTQTPTQPMQASARTGVPTPVPSDTPIQPDVATAVPASSAAVVGRRDAAAADLTPNDLAYRVTAERHLERAEAFLTLFRASARRGNVDELATATARELLASNRLLTDSPAASDPKMRGLFDDLELVLAQIATLKPRQPERDELDLITDGLEARGMLVRLRATTPVGTPAAVIRGEM